MNFSQLNLATDSVFDFTTSKWHCEQTAHDYVIVVRSADGQWEGRDNICKTTWKILTPRAKQLTMQSACLIAASNMIDNWRKTP